MGIEPTVYFLRIPGYDPDWLTEDCNNGGIAVEKYELGTDVDYYSLPNLIRTLKVSRFELLNEIINTELLTIKWEE